MCRLKTVCVFSIDYRTGNAQYEGFCIDIIIELAEIYKFNYVFINQHDKNYGSKDKDTGKWE